VDTMRRIKITEGQYALGGLTIFVVWAFFVLPLVSAYQAAQFARPPEYAEPHKQGGKAGDTSPNEDKPHKSLRESFAAIWERTTEDPTALFTACVAAFTLVLAISTGLLWRATKRTAVIAERAMTELEAPFVSIKIIETGIRWHQNDRSFTAGGMLQFSYINYGRTPATILEAFEDVRFVNPGEGLPPPINARNVRGPPVPWGVIAPPNGESQPFPFNAFLSILGEAGGNPEILRTGIPFFLGFVMFGDIFGNVHTLGFCFLFDRETSRFILAGGDEYNYCRKKRGPYRPPGFNRPAPPPPPPPPEPAGPEDVDSLPA
jgi:hypothetical protein